MEASRLVALMRKSFMMAGLARPVNFRQAGGATVPPAHELVRLKAEQQVRSGYLRAPDIIAGYQQASVEIGVGAGNDGCCLPSGDA